MSVETDRRAFLKASTETLRREVPDSLEWLFEDPLPDVKWADGTPTDPRLLKGWLAEAAQQDEVEPDAEQGHRARLLDPKDRDETALWLLRKWLANDLQKPPGLTEDRRSELRAMAEKAAEIARRFGRGGTDPEERYQQLLAQESRAVPASSLPHRGLLSLVAVCAGNVKTEIQRIIDDYLESHGDRTEQKTVLSRLRRALD